MSLKPYRRASSPNTSVGLVASEYLRSLTPPTTERAFRRSPTGVVLSRGHQLLQVMTTGRGRIRKRASVPAQQDEFGAESGTHGDHQPRASTGRPLLDGVT